MQIIKFHWKEIFLISQKEGYPGEKWKEKGFQYIYIKTNKQTNNPIADSWLPLRNFRYTPHGFIS